MMTKTKYLWRVEFSEKAEKTMRRIPKEAQRKIRRYLIDFVMTIGPRKVGTALKGTKIPMWRYRIGYYRVVVEILDHHLIVHVLRIAHRSDVYKSLH